MKKQLKLSLVAFMLMLSFSVAGSPSSVYLKVIGNSKGFILSVNGIETTELKITIKDSHDVTLYQEKFKNLKKKYSKGFDLKSLPQGNYFLEIENDYTLEIYTITITHEEMLTNADKKIVIFKPQIALNGDKLDIGYAASNGGPLKVSINDPVSGVIFQDVLNDEINNHKRYDLSQLASGTYTLNFVYANRYFSKSIYIN